MGRIFHPLLFLLAKCSRNQLIRQIEFLKVQNELLRMRMSGKFARLKPDERARLVQSGAFEQFLQQHAETLVRFF